MKVLKSAFNAQVNGASKFFSASDGALPNDTKLGASASQSKLFTIRSEESGKDAAGDTLKSWNYEVSRELVRNTRKIHHPCWLQGNIITLAEIDADQWHHEETLIQKKGKEGLTTEIDVKMKRFHIMTEPDRSDVKNYGV